MGSTNHLLGEFFMKKSGTDLLQVPYKGSAAAATDLVAGEVKLSFDTTTVAMPLVQSGKLKGLGLLSPQRSDAAPGVPALARHRGVVQERRVTVGTTTREQFGHFSVPIWPYRAMVASFASFAFRLVPTGTARFGPPR